METCDTSVQQERFARMLQYFKDLEVNEPRRFSLEHWITASDDTKLREAKKTWSERYAQGEPLNCGTCACVVGHMPVIFPHAFGYGEIVAVTYIHSREAGRCASRAGCVVLLEELNLAHFFGGTGGSWANIIHSSQYDEPEDMVWDDEDGRYVVPLCKVISRMEDLYFDLYGPDSEEKDIIL